MANRNNQHIDSPAFKEYAHQELSTLTPEQKDNLSTIELNMVGDDAALRRFCKQERIDHIGMVLAKVGIEWTIRFHKNEQDADLLEFNAEDQYKFPFKRLDVTETASRKGVCIISSRDVMIQSHMVAQNCTTHVYAISGHTQSLHKAGQKFETLSWDQQVSTADEVHDLFNDLLLEQLNSFIYAEKTLGLEEADLRILCALYKKRREALRLSEISTLTKAEGRKMYFRANMQKLMDNGLVMSDTKDVKKVWANSTYFMITTKGLGKIMAYRQFIHKNVFSF